MEFPTLVNWITPFAFKGVLGSVFHFYTTFCKNKRSVDTLIRRCVLRLLIWVCTICLCFTKRTLGFSPNSLLCFPCPCSVGRPDACSFFLGYFFLRTLDCLVSNCSWRNSQFIGIKFTLQPLPPSC